MSYGGSSLITTFACIGLVANVSHAPLQPELDSGQVEPDRTARRVGLLVPQMSNLWPTGRAAPGQGREARSLHRDGAGQPPAGAPARPASPGCSSTPTPTRSGCPTRGSRSSTRSSTNATTPSAERAYAPWVDIEAEMRAPRRAALLGRHPPRRRRLRRRSPSTSPPSSSTRTSSSASTSPACRCGPRHRRPEHPLVVAGGHCAFNPEPHGRLRRRVRHRRRRGGGRRDHRGGRRRGSAPAAPRREGVLRELATIPGVYVPVDVRRRVRRRRSSRAVAPALPRRARAASTSAPSPTSPSGRTRRTSSCRSSRSCTTASTSRCSAAARAAAASARRG